MNTSPLTPQLLPEASRETGQALLEFALCLPVLLLVVTGICVFGVFLNQYLTLTNAVTVAAQQLALSRGQTTDPCSLTATAVEAAGPSLTASSLNFTITLNGSSYTGSSCNSGSTTTGAAGNLVQGATAQVAVSYPCTLKVYGADYMPNCSVSAQTAEMIQ